VSSPDTEAWPRVSVVVPVKDTEPELLLRAVCSALHQDYRGEIEVLVHDDGSTRARHRFNHALLVALPLPPGRTLELSRSPVNRGISAARNAASRRAAGTWLLWLDSDDELPRGAVRLLVGRAHADGRLRLVAGQCRVVYPDGRRMHRNDRILRAWRGLRGSPLDPVLSTVFAVHGSLVHRDLFWKVDGFDVRMAFGELTDWFLRVLAAAGTDEVETLDAVTYVHHKRPASHSTNRAELEAYRQRALRRYAEAIGLRSVPTFRPGERCVQSDARRYSLLDTAGRTLVRDDERFSLLLYDTVPMVAVASGGRTTALPVTKPAGATGP
jgi:glycosyltransferase involved in cell wall biosynthesis